MEWTRSNKINMICAAVNFDCDLQVEERVDSQHRVTSEIHRNLTRDTALWLQWHTRHTRMQRLCSCLCRTLTIVRQTMLNKSETVLVKPHVHHIDWAWSEVGELNCQIDSVSVETNLALKLGRYLQAAASLCRTNETTSSTSSSTISSLVSFCSSCSLVTRASDPEVDRARMESVTMSQSVNSFMESVVVPACSSSFSSSFKIGSAATSSEISFSNSCSSFFTISISSSISGSTCSTCSSFCSMFTSFCSTFISCC